MLGSFWLRQLHPDKLPTSLLLWCAEALYPSLSPSHSWVTRLTANENVDKEKEKSLHKKKRKRNNSQEAGGDARCATPHFKSRSVHSNVRSPASHPCFPLSRTPLANGPIGVRWAAPGWG